MFFARVIVIIIVTINPLSMRCNQIKGLCISKVPRMNWGLAVVRTLSRSVRTLSCFGGLGSFAQPEKSESEILLIAMGFTDDLELNRYYLRVIAA